MFSARAAIGQICAGLRPDHPRPVPRVIVNRHLATHLFGSRHCDRTPETFGCTRARPTHRYLVRSPGRISLSKTNGRISKRMIRRVWSDTRTYYTRSQAPLKRHYSKGSSTMPGWPAIIANAWMPSPLENSMLQTSGAIDLVARRVKEVSDRRQWNMLIIGRPVRNLHS